MPAGADRGPPSTSALGATVDKKGGHYAKERFETARIMNKKS
jgi:hypothetical protein